MTSVNCGVYTKGRAPLLGHQYNRAFEPAGTEIGEGFGFNGVARRLRDAPTVSRDPMVSRNPRCAHRSAYQRSAPTRSRSRSVPLRRTSFGTRKAPLARQRLHLVLPEQSPHDPMPHGLLLQGLGQHAASPTPRIGPSKSAGIVCAVRRYRPPRRTSGRWLG